MNTPDIKEAREKAERIEELLTEANDLASQLAQEEYSLDIKEAGARIWHSTGEGMCRVRAALEEKQTIHKGWVQEAGPISLERVRMVSEARLLAAANTI